MKLTEEKLREAIKNGIATINEAKKAPKHVKGDIYDATIKYNGKTYKGLEFEEGDMVDDHGHEQEWNYVATADDGIEFSVSVSRAYHGEVEDWDWSYLEANESVVTEGKSFKNTTDFEKFLIEIDGMGEFKIKQIMGKDYIDTPGFYQDEKKDYDDAIDFMQSNMGQKEFDKLESWWDNNVAESVVNEESSLHKRFNKMVNNNLEDVVEILIQLDKIEYNDRDKLSYYEIHANQIDGAQNIKDSLTDYSDKKLKDVLKAFESVVNEAGDAKKYKQFWDKGPETQIRRRFGKEYNNAIENRVSLLLTLVEDPDKAEDYAEMDFLSLPDDISTGLVNMDPKELHAILDESVNEGMSKSAIKKAIKTIDKQIDTETGGDGEALDNETLQALEQEKERLGGMIESVNVNEASIELDVIDHTDKVLLKQLKSLKVKMKVISDKGPGGGAAVIELTGKREALEDVVSNPVWGWDDPDLEELIQEHKVNEAKFVKDFDKKVLDAGTEKDILKIYPDAETFVGKHSHFFGQLEPNLFYKAYYAKYYKEDTGESIKGDFKITTVYSKKGSSYVNLYLESANTLEAPAVNESVIGIKTERDFTGKDLKTALDKAKIKYKMNRLSMTLMVLDLDKKYYDDAKKVVDDLGLNVMMAKESKLTEASNLLKQDALSPAEYQKAKKLKGFDPANYLWDKKQELHLIRKMSETEHYTQGNRNSKLSKINEGKKPSSSEYKEIKKVAKDAEKRLMRDDKLGNYDVEDYEEAILQYYNDNIGSSSFKEIMGWFDGSDENIFYDYFIEYGNF